MKNKSNVIQFKKQFFTQQQVADFFEFEAEAILNEICAAYEDDKPAKVICINTNPAEPKD